MLRLSVAAFDPGAALPTPPLSAYRAKKLEGVKNPLLRGQMLTAERLLVEALAELGLPVPPELAVSEQGKPYLPDSPWHFSLSHSGRFAACAVADYPIGLDLQTPETLREALVRRFFTPEEQKALRESPRPDADFTALWCCKESYVKALGTGLYTPLSSFTVLLTDPPTLREDAAVRFWLRTGEDYSLALCAPDGHSAAPDKLSATIPLL